MTTTPQRYRFTVSGRPVPAVRMTQRGKFVKVPAQRYLEYRSWVGWTAVQAGVAVPLDGRLYGRLFICVNRRGREDAENWSKAIWDALQGIAYHNDQQIDDLHITVCPDCTDERVEIEIGVIAP